MRVVKRLTLFALLLACSAGLHRAAAQGASGASAATDANDTTTAAAARARHRRLAAAPTRAAQTTPGVAGAPAATPGPATARHASDTAGGVSGARRAAIVQGNVAAPTTAATLPSGTLDFGNGITTLANYTGEFAANPSGGIKQGGRYADQLSLGVDIDLGRLVGATGSSLHAIGTNRDGHSLTRDLVGNSISVQEIYGDGQTYRLSGLTFEQKAFNGRVDFQIGRLPAENDFFITPLYCNFQNNSLCGSPNALYGLTNFSDYPAPTWAGLLKLKLTDRYFFNVGAYEVYPTRQDRDDHGVDFFADATGYNVPFELGYATTFDNDALPRHFGVGAVVDRSSYNDPFFDRNNQPFLFSGLAPKQDFGRTLVSQRFDQMVYRPDPQSPRGLTVFGAAVEATGGRQTEDYYVALGAVCLGPWESRPYDSLDAFVSTQRYSGLGLANTRAVRRLAGLSTDLATNQTMFELNYGIQVSPAVRFMPNLQYILHPDQLRYPFREKAIDDALVIGAKLSVDLFTLAGLAKGPGSL